MNLRLAVPILLVMLVACSPINTAVTRLESRPFLPKPEYSMVQIFTEKPDHIKHIEIAVINTIAHGDTRTVNNIPIVGLFTRGTNYSINLDTMLPRIKNEARKLGADAVIIKSVEAGICGNPGKCYAVAIRFI